MNRITLRLGKMASFVIIPRTHQLRHFALCVAKPRRLLRFTWQYRRWKGEQLRSTENMLKGQAFGL